MRFREFEDRAFEHWTRIPDEYLEGIDGLRVLRRAKAHDELPDVWTMGECLTETYPSDFGGPDTIRSAVVLYWGSFVELSHQDPDFDWEDEIWETITHELRHHLESLAAEAALEDVDYAADENFRRHEGEAFDAYFYRAGDPVPRELAPRLIEGGPAPARGHRLPAWRVETEWFVEMEADGAPARVVLGWLGSRHAFDVPRLDADVTFALMAGAFDPPEARGERRIDEATIVLVRPTTGWRAAWNALRGRAPTSAHCELDVTTERT